MVTYLLLHFHLFHRHGGYEHGGRGYGGLFTPLVHYILCSMFYILCTLLLPPGRGGVHVEWKTRDCCQTIRLKHICTILKIMAILWPQVIKI